MIVAHLTSSTFFGGPERQMLGLAQELTPTDRSIFISFSEGCRCRAFLHEARREGFDGWELSNDTPHLLAAVHEIQSRLRETQAQILCCHGYKADLLGRLAARRQNIPVVAVSRGWTGENLKVRFYESTDRYFLRRMDRVVCVSRGQAEKVIRAKVPASKVVVIRNSINAFRFEKPNPTHRAELRSLFPHSPSRIVGAAGRLSPEKGFSVLIDAARKVIEAVPSVGFVLFGEGPLRDSLQRQIDTAGLRDTFILAGFRHDLDHLLPFLDILAMPSFTEGMSNVILEAFAAGVPVVGTAVGGTPEIIDNDVNGFLISPGDAPSMAKRITQLLNSEVHARAMGERGRQKVLRDFTFEAQALAYRQLFEILSAECGKRSESECGLPFAGMKEGNILKDPFFTAISAFRI